MIQRLFALLCVFLLWSPSQAVRSAPQLDWSENVVAPSKNGQAASASVDLRSRWEATLVGSVQLANPEVLDPQQIWSWPNDRFRPEKPNTALRLSQGERLVTRLTVFSKQAGSDVTIDFQLPRLDAVHVSYRHEGGPWTTLSAGDTIPIAQWSQPDRQPSFNLPLKAGQMDVVVQVAHRGLLQMPVVLQNTKALMQDRTKSIWIAGMMVGVSFVMALMGLLLALNFRHWGFLSVSVMSTMMALVFIFGSGLGGMYLDTQSSRFNDEMKFYANTNWSTLLPLVSALALGLRKKNALVWWLLSCAVAVFGIVFGFFGAEYSLRGTSPRALPVFVVVILLLTYSMIFWAWYREHSRNTAILTGLSLQAISPLLPFLAYLGWIKTDNTGQSAALISLLAGMLLLRGLFLQHRMGRQVLARASTSPMRDVLTGLLNRAGMQSHLYKLRSRLKSEQSCAVLIYVELNNEHDAMRLHGEEGFEMSLVQVAASLSTSVTGVDGLGRISRNAFAITVMMPPDPAVASRVAQKILSRLMSLSSHGAPLAGTARLSLSWLPLYGFRLDALEQRSMRALRMLDPLKRIGWVGGAASHAEAIQLLDDLRSGLNPSYPRPMDELEPLQDLEQAPVSSTLYERIHRIEREMLDGVDTAFLVAEAERMSRILNEASSTSGGSTQSQDQSLDHAPTEQMSEYQIKPA